MNNMENVKKAVKIIRDHKLDFALLHTTSTLSYSISFSEIRGYARVDE